MIWRRFLIKSNSTLKDLHYVIQILMGWTDYHLNEFIIKGRRHTVPNGIGYTSAGGSFESDTALSNFFLKEKEKFLYSYDFTSGWKFEVRLEKIEELKKDRTYPVCISGSGASPEEECGGPSRFIKLKEHWMTRLDDIMIDFIIAVQDKKNADKTFEEVFDIEELEEARYWLNVGRYARREINKFLTLYANGDERWYEAFAE